MTLDDAKAAEHEARKALMAVKIERGDAIDAAKNAIHAEFAERVEALSAALEKAQDAVTQAKNTAPDHEWEGRKVFRMESVDPANMRKPPNRVEGIVETVRIGAQFAINLPHYSRPGIGAVIVRLLKKDGTPGLKFQTGIQNWKLAVEPTS